MAVEVVDDPFIGVPAKVAGSGWRGCRWRTGRSGWDCFEFFYFLIYFRKLSKKRLKICGKF